MDNNNALQVFNYKGKEVRTTNINGETWWVAKDVCDILEITVEATRRLEDDEKGLKKIQTPSGMQDMTVINESGLYTLLMRSNKEEAKPFRRWVTHEVLPSINKHGAYLTPQKQEELIQNPDLIIRLAQELKAERLKVLALSEQAEKDRPKVIFADAVDASEKSILIGDLAKILRQNGIDIGPNRFFAWLRENHFLCNCKGERWNMPTQLSLEKGLFEVKTRIINDPSGSTRITRTTKVTGKGQIFFINKFLGTQSRTYSPKADDVNNA